MKTQKEVKELGLSKFSATKLSNGNIQKIKGGKADHILEDNVMLLIDVIVIEDNFL